MFDIPETLIASVLHVDMLYTIATVHICEFAFKINQNIDLDITAVL